MRLPPNVTLDWDSRHTDEMLLVRSGGLFEPRGEATCGAGDALVIESGARLKVVTSAETELVWFGAHGQATWELLGPPSGERNAYVIPGDDRGRSTTLLPDGVTISSSFWADSTQPTCRAALLEVSGSDGHHAPAHSHSQDEIIYVLAGSMRFGQQALDENMSIFIPANQRYRFGTQGPYCFVNFRRDASAMTMRPGSTPLLETAAGLVETPDV